ncbi:MAG: AMP-binding protein [Erysipelotrichaceae bacterium]|nr:AMP-binding protein [Erysipelotrichaceae bacterium]
MIWDLNKYAENKALIDDSGNSLSYSDLHEETDILYRKIGRRCLVFSLCQNEIGSVVGYVSFMNHSVVPVLLNSHIDEELLFNLIGIYKPAYIWAPADLKDRFEGFEEVYERFAYVLLKSGSKIEYPLFEELGLLLTTSGSTGSPKFVRQSYLNVKNNAEAIVSYLELDETEKPISTLPMNYTYGLSIINSHLLVGACILLTEKGIMWKEFWSFFTKEGATSFGGVPYTYEMLNKLGFYKRELPSLRTMTQAGGKILPELHEKFARYAQENGKRFIVMYGQCEATARMGYLPADMALAKKGSMGIPIPGGRFSLIDADGNEIHEPFVTGELVYEGKNVTMGYAECGEDLIKGDERGGILETGDMAQFDEDGYYYIVGRKKRFLKIFGNRVNLDEIDRLVKERFGIEAVSAGKDDHMYIFITESEFGNDVVRFVSGKTNLNPNAFKAIVIDEIPKNDAGKVLYKELNKYYE